MRLLMIFCVLTNDLLFFFFFWLKLVKKLFAQRKY